MISSSGGQPTNGGSVAWNLGEALTNSSRKTVTYFGTCRKDLDLVCPPQRRKQRKIDIRVGAWDVRSLRRSGSLKTVSKVQIRFSGNTGGYVGGGGH